MAASEGDGTPRSAPLKGEKEEEAYTPVISRTATGREESGVSLPDGSESSPAGSSSESRIDDDPPVARRDLARARRTLDKAIGVSLKAMHEEFTQLLMSMQQECSTRIDALTQPLSKGREVTASLIQVEAQKRDAL